ncbi:hypothetical protein Scep_018526 [Stephania cephalantha]|uniref:Uncharacterized protein n=1 Tax=Stephania cephalantha TaxID=152367 RepID=A0AAP0NK73_9MAGN
MAVFRMGRIVGGSLELLRIDTGHLVGTEFMDFLPLFSSTQPFDGVIMDPGPLILLSNSTVTLLGIDSSILIANLLSGMFPAPLKLADLEVNAKPPNSVKLGGRDRESCPFPWAWFPNNVLDQEGYLRLAIIFVLLRVIYLFHPILLACALTLWRRHIRNRSLVNLWECPLTYFKKVLQVFCALKEPCRKSNLQGGALNAGVWASKSLASVSIGDASTSS